MRFMYAFRAMLAVGLVGLVAAGPVSAQQADPGTIVGQVTQEDGTPLSSARVVAVSVQTGRQFGALTAADGRYVIIGLAPGSFRVEVRLIGYNTGRVDRVVVASAEST
ncbi:MAG: carboxypeptidase regulatory-like domain-containing protein, partial [Gemmatimonadetes bacterium]|nr:carboxypeptidase regulatory-like domain-containing protein [Gemmatimonadota bacterium]